ncbi:MAG: hypothetical protein ACRDOU_11255 [Streptosporangiaceae bacterium]
MSRTYAEMTARAQGKGRARAGGNLTGDDTGEIRDVSTAPAGA